jgi:folylpolyglutamate synthase/dihydrofolate synthase
MLQPFQDFQDAQQYLFSLSKNISKIDFDIQTDFIAKQTRFMEMLGHPEHSLKLIHIAGTSGKGSTAIILTDILLSQKFKIGTTVSPHIVDICERIQLNGKPISQVKFLVYLNQILPAIDQMIAENNPPSYFEVLTALQFYIFANEKVDYAVIEVGLGGRLDATNIFVPNKLCIINSIGLDHTEILGDTLVKIAGEKAGIIQENNQVITLSQSLEVNQVFIQNTKEMQADLDFVIPDFCFESAKQYDGKTYFSYIDQDLLDRQIALGMLGKYQASNASLALRATEALSERDNWAIDWDRLKYQLQSTKLIGRFEVVKLEVETPSMLPTKSNEKTVEGELPLDKGLATKLTGVSLVLNSADTANPPNGIFPLAQDDILIEEHKSQQNNISKTLILDGAHNPQKMQAFVANLVEYYPNAKFDFLLAFKKGKDTNQMLDEILKYKDRINKIILTRFDGLQDTQIESQDLDQLEEYLKKQKYGDPEAYEDLNQAYQSVSQNLETIGVITGSLYLISAVKQLDY